MKAWRTIAIIAALGVFGAMGLSGLDFDFGGFVENSSTPSVALDSKNPVWAMDQRDRLALWADMHFSPQLSLTAQGSYAFELDLPYLFDVDVLKLDWQVLPSLHASLGRFVFTDFTGHVLNHKLDGTLLTMNFPFMVVTAGAGFSGLELKPYSLMLMSRSDVADQSDNSVILAAPRLVEKLEVLFPNLLPRQDLTVSVILQQDFRSSGSLIQAGEQQQFVTDLSGGRLTSEYFGLGLSGAIVSAFYYDAFFYFSLGSTLSYVADSASPTGSSYQYEGIQAFLGGIGLRYYSEALLSSRVELSAIVSSGDADNTTFLEGNTSGASTLFVPISQETLGIAYQPQWGNLIQISADYSFKPVTNLQLMMKVQSYLRPTTGAIYTLNLDPSSSNLYLGTEIDGIANFRPFSDLGVAMSIGFFLPNGNAFIGQGALPVLAGRLEVSLSF
ncbi:MAG: hypothetical protein ABSB63_03435 [Spirochaetia bacterium]|jgi:hypothetical protein